MLKKITRISLILIAFCFIQATETAITVDNTIISTKEFNVIFNQFVNNYKSYQLFQDKPLDHAEIIEIKQAVLDELLEEAITKKYANQKNILVSTKEIQEKIEQIKGGFPNEKSFWKIFKDQKISFEELVASLEKEILKKKIIEYISTTDITITTDDLKEHFQQNDLGELPFKYNISLLVTSNKKYLVSLQDNQQVDFNKSLINKKLSLISQNVYEVDITKNIQELLKVISVGENSPLLEYDKTNFFIIKLNSINIDFTAIPKQITLAIKNEKKTQAYQHWLKKKLQGSALALNENLFPAENFNTANLLLFSKMEPKETTGNIKK